MWKTWVWSLGWKIAWRRERLPTPVFWPGEFHGVSESQIQLSDFHFYFLSHPSGCEVVFHCGFDLHFASDSQGFPGGSDGKEAACNVGELGLIPGLGRSPGEGMGTDSSILAWRICMDRGAWRATVHGVAKSRILLSEHSIMTHNLEHLFMCLFCIFFGKKSVQVICPFWNWVVCFCCLLTTKICKFSWSPICLLFLLLLMSLMPYPRNHCQIQCHEAFALCFHLRVL